VSSYKHTAVVDFDNTISGYTKWRGECVLGPIIPYAKDALLELREWGWRVVIFTTRGNTDDIAEWLSTQGLGFCEVNSTDHNPPGTSHKPIARVYFDDRDAHCVGNSPYNWHRAMARVRRLYRPRLDTHIDDAQVWSSWYIRWFVAPFRRKKFARDLPVHLDCIQLRIEGKEDVAKDKQC